MEDGLASLLFQSEIAGPCWHRLAWISTSEISGETHNLMFQCLAAGQSERERNCMVPRVQEKGGRNGVARRVPESVNKQGKGCVEGWRPTSCVCDCTKQKLSATREGPKRRLFARISDGSTGRNGGCGPRQWSSLCCSRWDWLRFLFLTQAYIRISTRSMSCHKPSEAW